VIKRIVVVHVGQVGNRGLARRCTCLERVLCHVTVIGKKFADIQADLAGLPPMAARI
jgi:hypothetical protein